MKSASLMSISYITNLSFSLKMYFETKKFLFKKILIFIYYFDCILQGSKFINVIAFKRVNIYLCLLLGNLHTNKNIVAFSDTYITVNRFDCDA